MKFNKHHRSLIISFFRHYCEAAAAEVPLNVPKKKSHTESLHRFFVANPHLQDIKPYIPGKYFSKGNKLHAEHLYLICPKVAKLIADKVFPFLKSNTDQVIAETNSGLGLVSTELLDRGVPLVRLYESCPDFRRELKGFGDVYPGRVELFTKDIFHLHRYAFMDRQDNGNRVEALLKNVPKRNWADDPVMTVIGTVPSLSFLKYLVRCLALQAGPALYGRVQMFHLMKPKDYAVFAATVNDNLRAYQSWSVIFNLLFEHELLDTYSRKVFLPWDPSPSTSRSFYPVNYEPDKLFLVRVNFKKELPVPFEQILPLYSFVWHFYGKGNNRVIPTIEKWVPGCGLNIILPSVQHSDYYEPMDIFTAFRELTPNQILAVFKEMINFPSYKGSPFTGMIESELVKSETIETSLADASLEKNIHDDMEEKMN